MENLLLALGSSIITGFVVAFFTAHFSRNEQNLKSKTYDSAYLDMTKIKVIEFQFYLCLAVIGFITVFNLSSTKNSLIWVIQACVLFWAFFLAWGAFSCLITNAESIIKETQADWESNQKSNTIDDKK